MSSYLPDKFPVVYDKSEEQLQYLDNGAQAVPSGGAPPSGDSLFPVTSDGTAEIATDESGDNLEYTAGTHTVNGDVTATGALGAAALNSGSLIHAVGTISSDAGLSIEANGGSIAMRSPDGSSFIITVSDLGVLVVTPD
jgi:hypothetical protein